MTHTLHTPASECTAVHDALKDTFNSGKTRPLSWRKHQLLQLARLVQENADALAETELKDLGKPKQETFFAEVGLIVQRSVLSASSVEEWAQPDVPEVPDWQKPWRPVVYKHPKGIVLIIAPWNYPIFLSLHALIGAIAAGCTAVIKPSEYAPSYAKLIAELLPKYLDASAFRIVNGGVPETSRLLELQWDHIFYTGGGKVAQIVSVAAAKYLTPVSLELGGKNPVIIDPAYDLNLAAKRILWGKINNAGQLCVSPDYVLIRRDQQDEFVEALKAHYKAFYPDGALNSTSYGRILNSGHHSRLTSLLERTSGTVAFGGTVVAPHGFEPTVVTNVTGEDALMEDEIFGPILAIVPVEDIDEAIRFVNARPHALVLYPFTEDAALKKRFIEQTASGSIVFNDNFIQLAVNEIPFAGLGASGHGLQTMKHSFDGFTHLRGSIDVPREAEAVLEMRYPPYDEQSDRFKGMTAAVRTVIPDDE